MNFTLSILHRYFHAWWESPPMGWQLRTDKQQLLKNSAPEGEVTSHSIALSNEWLDEVFFERGAEGESDESEAGNVIKQRHQRSEIHQIYTLLIFFVLLCIASQK